MPELFLCTLPENLMRLTDEEISIRKLQKYNPNFKLHYQYREYHISPDDLKTARPVSNTKVNLRQIHHSYHTLGLVLTFSINLGLSSRTTRDALKGIFDISLSHQTIINYINSSAVIYPLLLIATASCPRRYAQQMKHTLLLMVSGRIPGSLSIPKPELFVGIICLSIEGCSRLCRFYTTALATPVK